jgi:hypothetical protein
MWLLRRALVRVLHLQPGTYKFTCIYSSLLLKRQGLMISTAAILTRA